ADLRQIENSGSSGELTVSIWFFFSAIALCPSGGAYCLSTRLWYIKSRLRGVGAMRGNGSGAAISRQFKEQAGG
ncbi:MAG TPA: hypothetical protein PK166_17790, partial [Candidatus Hydrogenedentes bacterium]|nr:hypothetical protein [Candidatus Hydrogenedentota bacterium]